MDKIFYSFFFWNLNIICKKLHSNSILILNREIKKEGIKMMKIQDDELEQMDQ